MENTLNRVKSQKESHLSDLTRIKAELKRRERMLSDGKNELNRAINDMKNTDSKISEVEKQLGAIRVDQSLGEELQRKQQQLA